GWRVEDAENRSADVPGRGAATGDLKGAVHEGIVAVEVVRDLPEEAAGHCQLVERPPRDRSMQPHRFEARDQARDPVQRWRPEKRRRRGAAGRNVEIGAWDGPRRRAPLGDARTCRDEPTERTGIGAEV